jgi:signal transduction histidine kinase
MASQSPIATVNLAPGEARESDRRSPGRGQYTVYFVRDNGAGIAPRDVDKIFTMFKRLSQEPGSGPGHGVGMAIVKKLVARYGGDVWVTSTRGAGSTFYFDLPDSEDSSPNNVPAV